MPDEAPNTFDDIKPFIRMLEGSIDQARAKRLAQEGRTPAQPQVNRPGITRPATDNHASTVGSSPANPEEDTPVRAKAIPKARKIPFGNRSTSMSSHTPMTDPQTAPIATPRYRIP